jgi:hypothetical protein
MNAWLPDLFMHYLSQYVKDARRGRKWEDDITMDDGWDVKM